jgi:hypothetical protein
MSPPRGRQKSPAAIGTGFGRSAFAHVCRYTLDVWGASATTWTLLTCAAVADVAVIARLDPATPSVTIAGMMMARPMRMTPPWRYSRSGARMLKPAACNGASPLMQGVPNQVDNHALFRAILETETCPYLCHSALAETCLSNCAGRVLLACTERGSLFSAADSVGVRVLISMRLSYLRGLLDP